MDTGSVASIMRESMSRKLNLDVSPCSSIRLRAVNGQCFFPMGVSTCRVSFDQAQFDVKFIIVKDAECPENILVGMNILEKFRTVSIMTEKKVVMLDNNTIKML